MRWAVYKLIGSIALMPAAVLGYSASDRMQRPKSDARSVD
jgi:hypothetical protein